MKKIQLINIGCKVNFAETSRLKEIFSERGYEISNDGAEADVVLINTCTVTNNADADCRAAIRKAKKRSPEAFVGVFGCYAQLNPNELQAMAEVDAVFGIKEKFMIPDMLEELIESDSKTVKVSELVDLHFDGAMSCDQETRARAFLKIQDGCDYICTYCTIPAARGKSRGMDFDDISRQILRISDSGYKEVVLSGINIGEYKSSDGKKFIDAVRLIDKNHSDIRVRISSIEPNLLSGDIIQIVKESSVFAPHFHIPLQSGSNEILRLMKRRYNAEQFTDKILAVKDAMPDACIGVDVICGFPYETDELFDETYRLLELLPISYLHVFSYSERRGTPAADMLAGKVAPQVRKQRTNRLRNLSEMKLNEFYKNQIGKVAVFLPENFDAKRSMQFGHTENYVRVAIPTTEPLSNKFYNVLNKYLKNGYVESELI